MAMIDLSARHNFPARAAHRRFITRAARYNFAARSAGVTLAVAAIVIGLLGFGGTAVRAADVAYAILIDGRPLTDNPRDTGGLYRGGSVFADAVKMNEAFNGLISFSNSKATVTITLAQRTTGTFTKGSQTAKVAGKVVTLPAAPFLYNGDLYVPISAFVILTGSKLSVDQKSRVAALTTPAHR